ncbi:cellobiose phosphorylase [Ruminococcus sp. 5_1_39BFAA]|uniref:cellobiose phosphorylase n=1 Tax=Ruminococcus sp. 5_1_39BFAA TaxID=457412 RepID=UPI003567A783
MLDRENNYVMEDYQKKSLFYSFLPGISGEHGIPLWCYYLNRGQGIASFGVQDKDHSIMEFYPAHQAAERTPLLGFRTFLKVDGVYGEAFAEYQVPKNMVIGMNSMKIQESLQDMGIGIEVEYECLTEEPLAGLMRKVTIENTGSKTISLELADGMAELLPYGVDSSSMKEMGQTAKAWMQVLNAESCVPAYKVRASMEDSAQVTAVSGVHYGLARDEDGELLPVIVDREVMFGQDSALISAHGFATAGQEALLDCHQNTCNDVSCCFFLKKRSLSPGETMTIEELYGMAESQEILDKLVKRTEAPGWFMEKRKRAVELTEALTGRIGTKTGDRMFDAYCRQTFLDNLLRGGYPEQIGDKVVYLYSRKHGDMERDYNFFSMLPEYYSQGNGNFRDVNQNRRCETQYSPFVGDRNIKLFYNALQVDGYNPLGIEKVTYTMLPEGKEYMKQFSGEPAQKLASGEYTPGQLYQGLEQIMQGKTGEEVDAAFETLLNASESADTTKFIEGYWCDHWTYNLDLVESYLAVYPEREKELLFEDNTYTYRQGEARILPRRKRYEETENGLRQYHFLEKIVDTSLPENRYLKDEEGNVVYATLLEKMFSLATVKTAALDPYGMGIEMEGGKPGWYDALNGLPGLIGSSMAESYELERMLEYLLEHLEKYKNEKKTITILTEIMKLSSSVTKAGEKYCTELEGNGQAIHFWNAVNDAKEAFWEEAAYRVQGTKTALSLPEMVKILNAYHYILKCGIEKSRRMGNAVPATYYYYNAKSWEKLSDGILPTDFEVRSTPDFLEGAVHSLKLSIKKEEKEKIYHQVKESRLYDKKLGMYKVNASLSEASFELGRACAFTPGWLENESVWLHMEYKYLLELLKSGMYDAFEEDFHKAAVPFLDEETYGRSPLENSSFIASSANPNEKIHGKGFVARLSGSTAEFLQMWQLMMFGRSPFTAENGELKLDLAPVIPAYLVGEEKIICANFLGTIPVEYCLSDKEALIPGNYRISSYEILWEDGTSMVTTLPRGEIAERIREGKAAKIKVSFETKKMIP